MQNESEVSHCQMQSQTVLYPTTTRCRRRSRSRSAWLSLLIVTSILMAEVATETATAAQCPSIGESVLARQRFSVCVCMYTYARSLGLTLVTVTQSRSRSQSQFYKALWSHSLGSALRSPHNGSGRSSSCAEILAALLMAIGNVPFHFELTPTCIVFSRSCAH